jgi:hypothetical protein
MSNYYSDLDSKFPEQVDAMERVRDVDATTIDLVNQYYAYIVAENFTAATALLANNATLKQTIISIC